MATEQMSWKTKRVQNWTEGDVSDWILSLSTSLASLQPNFVGINGNQLLVIHLESKIRNKMLRRLFQQKLTSIKQNNNNIKSSTVIPMTITGLNNQGNTCFLNSAIQALLQTPQLTQYFRNLSIRRNGSMLSEWARLCKYAVTNPCSSFRPSAIYKMVVNSHKSYSFGAQDDAYFAATAIISMMDDEIASCKNVSCTGKYMMSKSSLLSNQSKEKIIKEFESKHNPKQGNIIRTLMDGIKATKRTCLACGYFKTTYESQRTFSLPLTSNILTLNILILINDCQFQYTTDNILEYSSIKVLKYHIQQYLCSKLQSNDISIENIKIGHVIKPKHIYSKNINQFLRFFESDDECSNLNSTAFAVCSMSANQYNMKQILIISVVVDNNRKKNELLHYHLESINTGNNDFEIRGDKIREKLLQIAPDLVQSKPFHFCCFCEDEVIKKDAFYKLDSCLKILINVLIPQNTKVEEGIYCTLMGFGDSVTINNKPWPIDIALNGKIVKVIQFKNEKQRWQCDLVNENPFDKYLAIKENHLKRLIDKNIVISLSDLAQILHKYIHNKSSKTEKSQTINQCIDMMNKTEIHDNNTCSLRCELCNQHSTLIKQETRIIKAPQILIFNLERSTRDKEEKQNQHYWRQSSWNKQTDLVEFNLDNLEYGSSKYSLYGVCNHFGSTSQFGHYTAFVKTIDHGKWFRANDSHTSIMSQTDIVSSSALVLMYTKK